MGHSQAGGLDQPARAGRPYPFRSPALDIDVDPGSPEYQIGIPDGIDEEYLPATKFISERQGHVLGKEQWTASDSVRTIADLRHRMPDALLREASAFCFN
jgi:hypothetical protein